MLRSALLLLASATVALTTVACSSLTKPDDIKIYAEPLPGVVKPATPPVPPPAARGAGPQGVQARPAPAAVPGNCGG